MQSCKLSCYVYLSWMCLAWCRPILSVAQEPDVQVGPAIHEADYQDRPHFVVKTKSATYWVDQKSGGLSRMMDPDGNDWIAFRAKPWDKYPESAASSFRGIPNAVFGGDDSGVGHPGWDKATTKRDGAHGLVTVSNNGKWQLEWSFDDQGASLAVTKSDPDRRYWFLYEGPIAGRWQPKKQYFATDQKKPVPTLQDYFKGDKFFETWRWAYFGDMDVPRVLVIQHDQKDNLIDTFAQLGNSKEGLGSSDGMVVFGFGRGSNGIEPLLSGKNSFRIQFVEMAGNSPEAYDQIKQRLQIK